jgi:hypothetical protein
LNIEQMKVVSDACVRRHDPARESEGQNGNGGRKNPLPYLTVSVFQIQITLPLICRPGLVRGGFFEL